MAGTLPALQTEPARASVSQPVPPQRYRRRSRLRSVPRRPPAPDSYAPSPSPQQTALAPEAARTQQYSNAAAPSYRSASSQHTGPAQATLLRSLPTPPPPRLASYRARSRSAAPAALAGSAIVSAAPAAPQMAQPAADSAQPSGPVPDANQPQSSQPAVLDNLSRQRSMWVCIYQTEPGGLGYVYLHTEPLSDETWASLPEPLQCSLLLQYCKFTLCRHVRGNWHNYHIYYNAEHPVIEENITFPNKILLVGPQVPIRVCPERGMLAVQHGPQPPQPARAPAGSEATAYLPTRDRWRPGYQGLFDVVCWLSDPTRSKLETHLANMMRSRVENGWPEKEPEYYYNRLESHWGKDAILHCGMTRAEVARLVIDDKTRMLYGVPSWSHRPWHWLFYRQEIDQLMKEDVEGEWRDRPLPALEEIERTQPQHPSGVMFISEGVVSSVSSE